VSATLSGFVSARASLVASSPPGLVAARALAELTDEAVSALAGAASPLAGRFAVFALGSYGAMRLLPGSDIDLLLVADAPSAETQALVRALLYPLWDTGIVVGHQVRTLKEQVRAVASDVEILTSFLTARLVTGDAEFAERVVAEVFRRIGRDKRRVLRELSERERPGSPYLLEPYLKEGAGGQRDLDELVWRTAIERGAPGSALPEGLVHAQEVLAEARWHLHASGAGNRMSLQEALDAHVDADDVQRALETVHHTLLAVRGRKLAAPIDFRALVALAERGDVEALESAAHAGALDEAVPGFGELMTLRRPALSHRYTVGAHSLRAFSLALQASGGIAPHMRDALGLAALAHDAGKADTRPGHAARGAALVPAIAERLGLPADVARDAAVLVREHLLLAEVATTHDLTDEDVVLAAAARLGRAELVAPLFTLTSADMQATGPDVWTPWRASLIAELAAKLEVALAPGSDGAGIYESAEHTRRDAKRQARKAGASRSVLAFLDHAPLRYLARRTATDVLRDARLVQELAGPGPAGELAFGVRPGPIEETWLVDVATRDHPGLFATISGALSLAGLDALSAEAFTERSGIAIDTFTVASATLAPVEPATWSAFERALCSGLHDPAAMEVRLAERRRHYDRRPAPAGEIAVAVAAPSPFSTAVRVRATDRVGLLHDLARAVARAGYDIERATITTSAGVADDVFEIVDREGAPPSEEDVRAVLLPLLTGVAN
jgi:UTP:GlnB (protein PII) uridylyltransferase